MSSWKLAALVASALLVIGVAGCKGEEAPATNTTTPPSGTTPAPGNTTPPSTTPPSTTK